SHLLYVSQLSSHLSHPHPAVHSFPTRRSSDLSRSRIRGQTRSAPASRPPNPSTGLLREAGLAWGSATPSRSTAGCPRPIPTSSRSEEHTSELQSPDHLVCRLLLEKQKQKITTN